jgi:hypothetical protein
MALRPKIVNRDVKGDVFAHGDGADDVGPAQDSHRLKPITGPERKRKRP